MANQTSTSTVSSSSSNKVNIPDVVRFWLLLFLDIPAACCSMFLLYHLLFKRHLRRALHNHIVIAILLTVLTSQLFNITFYVAFLRLSYVWWPVPMFCLIWWFTDTGMLSFVTILLSYGSFERHILVFNSHLVSTQRKRLLFHYIPFLLVLLYCFVFYIYTIFFPPCQNKYRYNRAWCSHPCYYDHYFLGAYDTIGNGFVLASLNIITDIGLIVRHIRHRHRIHQVIRWRKYRKMMIQLLSMSGLQLFFTIPVLVVIGAEQCGVSGDLISQATTFTVFFSYFIILLLPYACLVPFPELRKILYGDQRNWLVTRFYQTNIISPVDITNRSNK